MTGRTSRPTARERGDPPIKDRRPAWEPGGTRDDLGDYENLTPPDRYPDVTGGGLVIVKPDRDGNLTADQTCTATCNRGEPVMVLIVPPISRITDDAGYWLGHALHLAGRIEIHGPVGECFRRDVANGVLAGWREAWDEVDRLGRREWFQAHGYVGKLAAGTPMEDFR